MPIPFPTKADYKLDQDYWGEEINPDDLEELSSARLNNYLVRSIQRCEGRNFKDYDLWEEFHEAMEGWTLGHFAKADREVLKDYRTMLRKRGVFVARQRGTISYAKVLNDLLQEEEPHEWTESEIQDMMKEPATFLSMLNSSYEEVRPTIEQGEERLYSASPIPPQRPERTSRVPSFPPPDVPPRPPLRGYARFNSEVHPSMRPSTAVRPEQSRPNPNPFTPYGTPTTAGTGKLLSDMMKIYTANEKKYGGEEYEVLDVKLQIFFDCSIKVGLSYESYPLAYSIMLKGRAQDFYFDKIAGRSYDFQTMVEMTKDHFETDERRQRYLTEWRNTTLPLIMAQNKSQNKSQSECLEMLFDKLRTVQRGLSIEYQNEHNLRDQIINACGGVKECRTALFKPAPTFEGLCAELRQAVGQIERERELSTKSIFFQDREEELPEESVQHWTDRTYGGSGIVRGRFNRGNFRGKLPSRFPSKFPRNNTRSQGNPRFEPRTNDAKKCFVCGKQGCWSTNHTLEEKKKAYDQFQFQAEEQEEEFQQFLADYEGVPESGSTKDADAWTISMDRDPLGSSTKDLHETFWSELGEINGYETIAALDNQTFVHALTREDIFDQPRILEPTDSAAFTSEERYSANEFKGIMPDTGASGVSTAGERQVQALQKIDSTVRIDRTKGADHKIRFGKGSAVAIGTVDVSTPVGTIRFYVVPTPTPFLWCIQDMDKLQVKIDNLENVLIQGEKKIPLVRRWGHPWMLLYSKEKAISYAHLTEKELRQLHRRFGHPSVRRLAKVLERAGYDEVERRTIEKLTKYCEQCQIHSKSPGRFKFTLKDDYNFNYMVYIDILYLEGKPVLQAVDEATGFNAARFLPDMTAKAAWDAVRMCWIDMYQGPPDYFVHDAGTNFASKEFRQNARAMAIDIKEVPVEAHNSVGKVERYHAPLRRAYDILRNELRAESPEKEVVLQMAVKAVNDTAGPNGIVPTLLVFGSYPRISDQDPPASSMVKRTEAMHKAMQEIRVLHAKRQVTDALAARNGPRTVETLNLPLQSDVRVWKEKEGWQGPYKLISTEGETCTIQMPHGPTNYRTVVVKPFYKEKELPEESTPTVRSSPRNTSQNNQLPDSDTIVVEIPEDFDTFVRSDQRFHEVFTTKKEQADLEIALDLRRRGVITTPGRAFEASERQEIEALIAKDVFEFVSYDAKIHQGRIFNSRLVNEVKGKGTDTPYEKSRLVIQAYNDEGKEVILTQSPTIQRASQRLIVALAPSLVRSGINLSLRDVTQAYVQSTTFLNREILAQLPKEIRNQYPQGTIMLVRKPLYGIPEAGTHWWATYHKHHREKLHMATSSYDPCLLVTTTTKETFGIVGMQTDDTLILGNEKFIRLENEELTKAKIQAKPTEKLSYNTPLIFNGCILQMGEDSTITLIQKGQGAKISLVDTKASPDERKSQYRENRARGAYIATICQPEASYDLSVAAQHQEPADEDIRALNKRLQWQIHHLGRGIRYISLDLLRANLYVFVDGSFANNQDLSSQIGYEIILANETPYEDTFRIQGNLIHYSSTKSKRVTRSVLASEIYGMVGGVDMAIAISTTIQMITSQLEMPSIPIVVCTDSYSLYECLVKLGTTKEKRLMIDIMALRQSYERRELTEIRWINGQDNPADAMTKSTPNKALEQFIDTNELLIRVEGWVKRGEK